MLGSIAAARAQRGAARAQRELAVRARVRRGYAEHGDAFCGLDMRFRIVYWGVSSVPRVPRTPRDPKPCSS